MDVFRVLSLDRILGTGLQLSPVMGGALAGIGVVYLIFGKRLFRFLIVGAGAAAGYEAGRVAGVHLEVNPLYTGVALSLVSGGLAWPLWQFALFVIGGLVGAVFTGEALVGTTGIDDYMVYGLLSGFILGGIFSVLLTKVMSVGLTAVLGAGLVYVGGLAVAVHFVPGLKTLPSMTLVSIAILGVLTGAGVVAQMAQGDPEENERRRQQEKKDREAEAVDQEAKRRWERYLGNSESD